MNLQEMAIEAYRTERPEWQARIEAAIRQAFGEKGEDLVWEVNREAQCLECDGLMFFEARDPDALLSVLADNRYGRAYHLGDCSSLAGLGELLLAQRR